ncbi:hypothetical protein OAP78_01155 [Candidatus Pelagibacter sp.]|nr:hypothetical protein [Candidatus Pelagibacter sp.]
MIKKNSLNFDYNKSSVGCNPCFSECKKIEKKMNNRKLSEVKNEEIDQFLNVFDKKNNFLKVNIN